MQDGISIFEGDCLELMDGMPDGSIDMILCDLPYGITARNHWDIVIPFEPLWKQYKRVAKEDAAIVLFASGMFTANLMKSNEEMWRYNLVWQKTTPTGFLNAKRMPLRSHEDVCVFYRKLPTYHPQKTKGVRKVSTAQHKRNSRKSGDYGDYRFMSYDSDERYPTSILTFPTDKQKSALHPTQKPVALLEWLVRTYTDEGDAVLDNCMGSGSTGIACMNANRKFVGMERDPVYFDVAKERMEGYRRMEICNCVSCSRKRKLLLTFPNVGNSNNMQ